MRTAWKRIWLVTMLVLPLTASVGCPDSEVVGSFQGQFALEIQVTPPVMDRFEISRLSVASVNLRPADPTTRDALGDDELIGVLTVPVSVDLNSGTTESASSFQITPGTYEVIEVRLNLFQFEDTTDPLPPAVECIDLIAGLSENYPPDSVQSLTIPAVEFDPPPTVTVPDGGVGTLRMTIDGPAFLALVEGGFICVETGQCVTRFPPVRAPCLEFFLPNSVPSFQQRFLDALATQVISFQ